MKRGTKLTLTSPLYNSGKPFIVRYFKKVRNSDVLVEVSFPFEVDGGGIYQVQHVNLAYALCPVCQDCGCATKSMECGK